MKRGLAQNNYIESYPPFWALKELSWQEKWIQKKYIEPTDLLLAKKLSNDLQTFDYEKLWAYLFAASRKGHLCVQIQENCTPSIKEVFQSDQILIEEGEEEQITREICEQFSKLIQLDSFSSPYVVIEDHRLYLSSLYQAERQVWKFIESFSGKPEKSIEVQEEIQGLTLEQQKAISGALSESFSIITGGPGVGKTYTAAYLVRTFLDHYPKSLVALVAPTGKAVANLQSAFSNSFNLSSNIEVTTLHKLLMQKIYSYLPYDLILVDESSMIDLFFMQKLLKNIKPKSRLILLGDPNQLPPIESGFIFKDLVRQCPFTYSLTECLRVEKEALLKSASFAIYGQEESFIEQAMDLKQLYPLDTKNKEHLYTQLQKKFTLKKDLSSLPELFEFFTGQVVLCSMRKGLFGYEAMNQSIKKALEHQKIMPIMIVNNDSDMELYNGDVGILVNHQNAYFKARHKQHPDYQPNIHLREVPLAILPSYEPAYCLSVHKSQGSEYNQVTLVLAEGSEIFGRELLYTAITRAKKTFEIFSGISTLKKIIKRKCQRVSTVSLKENLSE